MTREKVKELLPILQAFAEGKTIQYETREGCIDLDTLNPHSAILSKYRIKSEPKYRPFKTQEECWNEMMKHQPFGWVRAIMSDNLYLIESISYKIFCNKAFIPYNEAFAWFKFADDEPFGIKE